MAPASVLRAAACGLLLIALGACDAPAPVFVADASVPRIDAPLDLGARAGGVPSQRLPGAAVPVSAPRMATLESSPTGDELAFVRALLTEMQVASFAGEREYCGYVGRDASGRMTATQISVGNEASCLLPRFPPGMAPLASVHTHGTYSPYYESEFPTVQDMLTDASDSIDGYIATPGGRLWYVDSDTMTVRMLCGRGCLPQDPFYRPEDDGDVRPSYTLRQLQAREAY